MGLAAHGADHRGRTGNVVAHPTAVIEDDATSDVDTNGVFDLAADGIDFYESRHQASMAA